MPRYFFQLRFGQRLLSDEEGIELSNRTAARDEAVAVVREFANPKIEGARRRWAGWFLEVADESGGFFRTHLGHPALEVVTPDHQVSGAEEPKLKPAQAETSLPVDAFAKTRTAEIAREMLKRRQQMAQLLKRNQQLRSELSSLRLATKALQVRTKRLVSLAREAGRWTSLLTACEMASTTPIGTFPCTDCLI